MPGMPEQAISPSKTITVNQVIAWHLHRLRTQRGWKQSDLLRELEQHGYTDWTASKLSDAENARLSTEEKLAQKISEARARRSRTFSPDEIAMIARIFNVPVWTLFVPPEGSQTAIEGSSSVSGLDRDSFVLQVLHLPPSMIPSGEALAEVEEKARRKYREEAARSLTERTMQNLERDLAAGGERAERARETLAWLEAAQDRYEQSRLFDDNGEEE